MASKSLKDFEPFFGGDQRGAFLVQAMFNGTNYTDRHGYNSGLMSELLRADNYKNTRSVRSSINGQEQGAEDVHQDITDLIITTALFHKSIDASSTAGTNLGDAIDRINNSLSEYLNEPRDTGRHVPVDSAFTIGQSITRLYGLPLQHTNSSYYMHLLADRAIWEAAQFVGNVNSLSNRQDASGHTHADALAVVDCGGAYQNICWGAVLRTNPSAQAALTALQNAGVANAVNLIQTAVENSLKTILTRMILTMKRDMIDRYPGISQRPVQPNAIGQMNVATVKAFLDPATIQRYQQLLKDLVRAEIPVAIRTVVNTAVAIPHTSLTNADAKRFFDQVYAAWPNMNSDIKQFYGQNISIFAKTTSAGLFDPSNDPYRKQQMAMDWVRLTPNEVDALFRQGRALQAAELANLRVNLMKSPASGLKDILFGSNLPDVPSGSNVWYTQSNGAFGHINAPPADFLRKLYATVYSSGALANPANINVVYANPAVTLTLNSVETNVSNRPKGQFNLNLGKFTAAAIRREDEQIEAETKHQAQPVDASLDAYTFLTAYDMVYGQLWTFDTQKGQYYRIDENNRRVYYDDAAKSDTKTCYASYLGKGDSGCLRVIQCIADGNSKSLNRCLDVIGDGDLWEVAADDVQKVGPDMVKLVLRKFGVKGYEDTDSNGVMYKVPMSYEEWMNIVVAKFPDDVRNTIMNNNKLKTYIKGLIGICRANPNILNRNNPSIVARDTTPEYIRNLNMRKYKIPSINRKTQYEFFAEQLRNAVQPHIVEADMFNPITSGSFANVAFINPYTTAVPAMLGGGFYAAISPALPSAGTSITNIERQSQILKSGSSSMFRSLLQTLTNAMADTGLRLHSEDEQRLSGVLKKIETYENQLARLCSVLTLIVKIARFYGVSLENVDKDHPRILKLSELQTIDDVRDFVRGYARELTKNMVANMSIQQGAAYELMNKVGPRLLDDCTGRQSVDSGVSASSRQFVNI